MDVTGYCRMSHKVSNHKGFTFIICAVLIFCNSIMANFLCYAQKSWCSQILGIFSLFLQHLKRYYLHVILAWMPWLHTFMQVTVVPQSLELWGVAMIIHFEILLKSGLLCWDRESAEYLMYIHDRDFAYSKLVTTYFLPFYVNVCCFLDLNVVFSCIIDCDIPLLLYLHFCISLNWKFTLQALDSCIRIRLAAPFSNLRSEAAEKHQIFVNNWLYCAVKISVYFNALISRVSCSWLTFGDNESWSFLSSHCGSKVGRMHIYFLTNTWIRYRVNWD